MTHSPPGHRRRMQALQRIPFNDEESDERNASCDYRHRDSHKARQVHASFTHHQNSQEHDNGPSPASEIESILNNFKMPEGPRIFKTEPMETDWDGLQSPKISTRKKRKAGLHQKGNANTRVSGRQAFDSTSADRSAERGQQERASFHIVDLTADDVGNGSATVQRPMPQSLTEAQIQVMNSVDVPHHILDRARRHYLREGIHLPDTVAKWHDLKAFVEIRYKQGSSLTPESCTAAQAQAFWAASGAQIENIQNLATPRRLGFRKSVPFRQNDRKNMPIDQTPLQHASPHQSPIKCEPIEDILSSFRGTINVQQNACFPSRYSTQTMVNDMWMPSMSGNLTSIYQVDRQQQLSTTPLLDIDALMKPLDLLLDLLPPDAPEGHPRLIRLWDPCLLGLPEEKHNHLKLHDTVVSIFAKYDLKNQTVIQAFLDVKRVPHFFFLFKAKTSNLHSWSVEREDDVITIGIERQRAPNLDTTEASRPSAGQYDLTVRYRVLSPGQLVSLRPEATVAASTKKFDSNFQPSYPGCWQPTGASIFPSSPDVTNFLYSTPPSRGADEHEIYHHPQQTPLLPSAHLAIFARYLQNTAFKTCVMDGEFQVAYGRKVRYDAMLGRVRAVWSYALQGAKTQKEKRERGAYNRPLVRDSSGKQNKRQAQGKGVSASHPDKRAPGYGAASGYLAGSFNGPTGMDDFAVEDEVEEPEVDEGAGGGGEDRERVRKKIKTAWRCR